MLKFHDYLKDGIDYFVLLVPEELVPEIALINEGRWVLSGEKDWMERVDAKNPSLNQLRHVHVARAKHVNVKTQQASWNDDLTRHDRQNFNSKIGSIKTVQDIAKRALKLPHDAILEEASPAARLSMLLESINTDMTPGLFIVKRAKQ